MLWRGARVWTATSAVAVAVTGATIAAATTPGEAAAASRAATSAHAMANQPETTLHLTKTIHVRSHNVGTLRLSGTKQIITVQLLRGGRAVGSGAYTCTGSSSSAAYFNCKSAIALSGGVLLFNSTVNVRGGSLNGTVTGGNGSYAGAQGTVKGTARPDLDVNLTVTYFSNET